MGSRLTSVSFSCDSKYRIANAGFDKVRVVDAEAWMPNVNPVLKQIAKLCSTVLDMGRAQLKAETADDAEPTKKKRKSNEDCDMIY